MKFLQLFFFKNVHVTYFASLFSSVILIIVLDGYIDSIILYGWFILNLFVTIARIWLSRIHPYPLDDLRNKKSRKILLYIGITTAGLVWASSAWLLFPEDNIVGQMFLVFVLMGMTTGSPAASASSIIAFLCFSQPILFSLSLRFIYEGEQLFYIMAGLTQIHNLSLITTSINFTKIDKRLRAAKETAETASLAKSEFLANISHEVRTPMNAIVGINHLLKQTPLTSQQLALIDKSLLASNSMLGSIENILDYSKIEQKNINLELSPFHLEEVLDTVTTLVELNTDKKGLIFTSHIELNTDKKGLIFTSHIEKNTTSHLNGDSMKLIQVLRNLAENAVKFTDEGKIELTVKQIQRTDKKVLIHFSLRDTGIGIDNKDHRKLFKSFTQVNTTYSRQYGGTGLGLSISQRLANLMGSEIEFESVPGQGSVFYFSVWFEAYLDTKNVKNTKTRSHLSVQNPTILPVLKGYNILLIEDDELNQLVAGELLTHLGVRVEIAGTAQQAFEILNKYLPDLILLDIQMPQMDGYETIATIRAHHKWKYLPVICLTAHSNADEKEKALTAGMDAFLTKPVDPIELRATLLKWLPQKSIKESTQENSKSGQSAELTSTFNTSQKEITDSILNVTSTLNNNENTITFYKNAKVALTKSANELQQHLTNNDWRQASLCAHRLRGTANFYASSTLQQCLQGIDEGHITSQNVKDTLNLLNIEFKWVIDIITEKVGE